MTKAIDSNRPIPSRRALLAGAPVAAAAALAGGTIANAVAISMAKAGEVDPVFAAIECERAAYADYLATGAPLSTTDERVLALIRRSLAAWHALNRDCSGLNKDGSREAMAKLRRLDAAVTRAEDELAEIAENDTAIRDWLEGCVGSCLENSRFRQKA
jgi:hypothetical protein